jgi:ferredoxin-like protein FixX
MKYSDEKVEKIIKSILISYCPREIECLQDTLDNDDNKCIECWQQALVGDDK